MGLASFFDPKSDDDLRRLREEVADLGHNLKRVMEHLGIDYQRNPLLEISPAIHKALREGDDKQAVELAVTERNLSEAGAAEFIRMIKQRLGMGDLNVD